MHTIDKWYVSNLNSRPDKWDAQELVSVIQKMPVGILQRIPAAIENENLPDTRKELSRLMASDGFPEWSHPDVAIKDSGVSRLASDWTKLCALRQVIESSENAVITTDNAYLIEQFPRVERLVASAPNDLNALYLHWNSHPEMPRHMEAMSKLEPSGVPGMLKNFELGGWIVYFTNKGAKWFMDLWREIPSCDGQNVVYHAARRYGRLEGVYACNPQVAVSVFELDRFRDIRNGLSLGNALIVKDKSKD